MKKNSLTYTFVGMNPFAHYADFEGKTEFSIEELAKVYSDHNLDQDPEQGKPTPDQVINWLESMGLLLQRV